MPATVLSQCSFLHLVTEEFVGPAAEAGFDTDYLADNPGARS
ncbi:hypothetical protein [Rhodococcus marinonascens]|nr:hypothetical protein [Rhodococcus marinonascens]